MVYTPFDFNEAVGRRKEYVEDRLRAGSPVVGVSYPGGVLLLTVRRSQRKVYEIYERVMFAGVGNQADVEAIRVAAIDVAHREGYERSPDDVTAQRLVGFALSPPLRRLFGDQFNSPAVVRGLFAELGADQAADAFYALDYDGDYTLSVGAGALAAEPAVEERMKALLLLDGGPGDLQDACQRALRAWALGARERGGVRRIAVDAAGDGPEAGDSGDAGLLADELAHGVIEAGVLDRATARESKFRLLSESETRAAVEALG